MHCPFCQAELDLTEAQCLNCGRSVRRSGMAAGVKLRILGLTGLMLILGSLLTNCVANYYPGGPDSGYALNVSTQQPSSPSPNLRSPEVQQQLADWAHGRQGSQNNTPPPPLLSH